MRIHNVIITALLTLACLAPSAASGGQEAGVAIKTEVIDLYRGAPIRDAIDVLRQRYYLPITYEGPVYACQCDLADMTYTRKTPGPKIIVPKRQPLHFEYTEISGKPQEDMTLLIHRLLAEYAAQGGPVFDVRERTMPKGTEWNVVALKAHGSSAGFVDQPDILGAPVFIPKARRSGWEFLDEMLRQVQTETGYRVVFGTVETKLVGEDTFGADNVSARDVLAKLLGTEMVWDLNYDPEGEGKYVLNLVQTPRPPQPPNPYTIPKAPPAELPPTGSAHIPIPAVMRMAAMPRGIRHTQSVLAQAGYYSGELTAKWDDKTIDSLKKFQAANNLPVTGTLDPETIRKLGLDVVTPKPQ
jgi:Putative peptidoglycan binding domain